MSHSYSFKARKKKPNNTHSCKKKKKKKASQFEVMNGGLIG